MGSGWRGVWRESKQSMVVWSTNGLWERMGWEEGFRIGVMNVDD